MEANSTNLIQGQVIAILENVETGARSVHETTNIVTDDGNVYYAERGAAETPTLTIDAASVGVNTVNPTATDDYGDLTTTGITNPEVSVQSGYPKTNDTDADNTGAGSDVVTWKFIWGTGDGITSTNNIADVLLHEATATGTDAILSRAEFAATFAKTNTDTLTVYVNHTMLGV